MADPKDPLAEHPLGNPAPRPSSRKATPLSLFSEPDLGEVDLGSGAPPPSPAPAPQATPRSHRPAPPAPTVNGSLLFPETPGDAADASHGASGEYPGPDTAPDAAEEGELTVAFARRVVAGLADLLILALFGAVEVAAGAFFLDLKFPLPALVPLGAFLFLAALVLMVLAPFVWGMTPGMALVDLKVVAGDGGSPTLLSAFLRFLGFLLTGALAGIPLLVVAFDRRGRTLADLVSSTTLEPAR